MKKTIFIALALTALLLNACAGNNAPTAIPTIVLDGGNPSPNDNNGDNSSGVTASAVIVPVNDARLSFSSVGRVTSVEVKVGDTVTAGQTLVRLDTTILEARVREAEANLAAAQAQVRFLMRQKTDQVHLEEANAEVDRAQALLDSANATLTALSTLTAPFDGVIVSVDIAPAEVVVPGQAVIVLGDLSSFQVETTDLSELDVTKIQVGQAAVVFVEALNEEFAGRVTDIDRIGSTLGGEVVFTVTLTLDHQPDGLLWGMSADVEILTGE